MATKITNFIRNNQPHGKQELNEKHKNLFSSNSICFSRFWISVHNRLQQPRSAWRRECVVVFEFVFIFILFYLN